MIHNHKLCCCRKVQTCTAQCINPSNTNRCRQGFRLECIYKVTNYVPYYTERERAPTNRLINVSCSHDKRFIFIITTNVFLQGGPKIYLLQEKTRLYMTQSNNCEIADVLGSLPSWKLCSD